MKRALLISDICFSTERVYDLFEVSPPSIEESIHHGFRYFEMTGISVVPRSIFIFDIHDSEKPVSFSFIILIYSTFHTDEIVSLRIFSTCVNRSIFCSCSEFFERRGHIRNS